MLNHEGCNSVYFFLITSEILAACLKEGDEMTLPGIINPQLFYGPPNYGEIRNKIRN